jgi:hypothetical protein
MAIDILWKALDFSISIFFNIGFLASPEKAASLSYVIVSENSLLLLLLGLRY